ncbi:hypothetical protein CIB95_06990 [Lottiidibacillus patelloidae]|uniref:Histone deacetylase n=1 Tax=Lottiidibacillus patelloidae TaxID=2670334 RepID=A0A263BU37_9BACI|nr:hypothetical protein [Lottiidibacillus patelloidae]OZM57205.1 hypothetical protein CIB95_06990 [Lottiidibacillus patelloidae]
MEECVWYASYGSNLLKERFLCYITGGRPEGSLDTEPGCRDNSLPKDDRQILISHPLYFAKEAARWGDGGVAFIGGQSNNDQTLGRMYLITKDQFIDVVSQENRNIEVSLDLENVKSKRNHLFEESWYGNVVYLGDEEGYPIFTFTANWDEEVIDYKSPSKEYLGTIIRGLLQTYKMDEETLVNYLINKKGIDINYNQENLRELIQQCELSGRINNE